MLKTKDGYMIRARLTMELDIQITIWQCFLPSGKLAFISKDKNEVNKFIGEHRFHTRRMRR